MCLQAYGSRRKQETVRLQHLFAQDFHVRDGKVPKPVCAHRLVNGEMHRCVLRIAICYESVACVAVAGKCVVKRVHVQCLVNGGVF